MKQLLLALATLNFGACATHMPIPGVPYQVNPTPQHFYAACTTYVIANVIAKSARGEAVSPAYPGLGWNPCLK